MSAPHSLAEFLTATTFTIGTHEDLDVVDVPHSHSDLAHVPTRNNPNPVSIKIMHKKTPKTDVMEDLNPTQLMRLALPPTSQRILKNLRSAGISRGIPLDQLTDERLEQRIAARRE